jgi:DNA-directed RNA polymerase specialized sigma24 family protein
MPSGTSNQEGLALAKRENAQATGLGVSSVEVLAAYSHSARAADLGLCLNTASMTERPKRRAVDKRPWSLSDRLDETQRLAIVEAYRSGATAAQLATTHDLSLSSLKRILRSAKATKLQIQS